MALFDPAVGLTGEWVHSQIERHQPYGGVVPEIASREHLANFPRLLRLAQEQMGDALPEAVAVTQGPGLAACLALGISAAKALSLAWDRPLRAVNHLRGHAWSVFIETHREAPAEFESRLAALLPQLGLIVSGGNTLLVELDEQRRIRVLAETVDDAAGEALDKGAKLMGMPYPGGPLVEKRAQEGDAQRYSFPRAFARDPGPKFSFSGLKTSLRYLIEKMDDAELEREMPHICASYQEAVVDALVQKTGLVLEQGRYRSVGLSGGVSNNKRLRALLGERVKAAGLPLLAALPRHTGDNAAMIAFTAWADPLARERVAAADLLFEPSARIEDPALRAEG